MSIVDKFSNIGKFDPPKSRYLHSMSCDGSDNVYMFGGSDGQSDMNDLWGLKVNFMDIDKSIWKEIHQKNKIPKREGSPMIFYDDKLWIICGVSDDKFLNDISYFDLTSFEWHTIPFENKVNVPPKIGYMTANLYHNKILIFGGSNSMEHSNVLYEFNCDTYSFKKLNVINNKILKSRANHQSCILYDDLIIYGGISDTACDTINDIHCINLKTLMCSKISIDLSPLDSGLMLSQNNNCIIVGGDNGRNQINNITELKSKKKDNKIQLCVNKKNRGALPYKCYGLNGVIIQDRLLIFGGCIGQQAYSNFTLLLRLYWNNNNNDDVKPIELNKNKDKINNSNNNNNNNLYINNNNSIHNINNRMDRTEYKMMYDNKKNESYFRLFFLNNFKFLKRKLVYCYDILVDYGYNDIQIFIEIENNDDIMEFKLNKLVSKTFLKKVDEIRNDYYLFKRYFKELYLDHYHQIMIDNGVYTFSLFYSRFKSIHSLNKLIQNDIDSNIMFTNTPRLHNDH